jgi:hypothetical protein
MKLENIVLQKELYWLGKLCFTKFLIVSGEQNIAQICQGRYLTWCVVHWSQRSSNYYRYEAVSHKVPLHPTIDLFPMKQSPLSFKTFEESDADKWSWLAPSMPSGKVSEFNNVWFKDPIVE